MQKPLMRGKISKTIPSPTAAGLPGIFPPTFLTLSAAKIPMPNLIRRIAGYNRQLKITPPKLLTTLWRLVYPFPYERIPFRPSTSEEEQLC